MSRVSFVLSVHSTVLFDALLVGKVPVQVVTPCDDRELHTKLEILNVGDIDSKEIKRVFSKSTIMNYSDYMHHDHDHDDDIDWCSYIGDLTRS